MSMRNTLILRFDCNWFGFNKFYQDLLWMKYYLSYFFSQFITPLATDEFEQVEIFDEVMRADQLSQTMLQTLQKAKESLT